MCKKLVGLYKNSKFAVNILRIMVIFMKIVFDFMNYTKMKRFNSIRGRFINGGLY
jgi:hypothetical protein